MTPVESQHSQPGPGEEPVADNAINREAFLSWMSSMSVSPEQREKYSYETLVAIISGADKPLPVHEWAISFLDGKSVADIAQEAGKNPGNVYTALGSLARKLAQQ